MRAADAVDAREGGDAVSGMCAFASMKRAPPRDLTPMASHTGPRAGQKSASGRRRGWTPARVKAAWSRYSLNSFSLRGDRHSTDDVRSTTPQRRRADSSVFGLRSLQLGATSGSQQRQNGVREHPLGDLQPSEFSPLRELPARWISYAADRLSSAPRRISSSYSLSSRATERRRSLISCDRMRYWIRTRTVSD